ncbi:TetR/AcrR family transcriptional regulator [Rothia sp. AR01]|uniref:TetR/AcrR family transcriptional regulator n=1 Tax=Rothia santali TaxID=2949643 RepID=A0A9X2HF20_9MICC|nr:TetR/AcrR family transcriptional regulator [Rothia santali]MCP3427155.1 TetR/AcrR family transcriptional regulator [Rothia santali]
MALTRERILDTALDLLSAYGLGDLSMRRIAGELEVAPGALYYHVKSKQELLAQLAQRMLGAPHDVEPPAPTGPSPVLPPDAEPGSAAAAEEALRRALLVRERLVEIPDAADVVSLALALRPDAVPPLAAIAGVLESAGVGPERAGWAARTVLHVVLGFVGTEQDLARAGAAASGPGGRRPGGRRRHGAAARRRGGGRGPDARGCRGRGLRVRGAGGAAGRVPLNCGGARRPGAPPRPGPDVRTPGVRAPQPSSSPEKSHPACPRSTPQPTGPPCRTTRRRWPPSARSSRPASAVSPTASGPRPAG